MRKLLILCTFIIIFPMTICLALDTGTGLEILEYEEVHIVIEYLSQDALDAGLSRDLIRSKVELQLRRNGLKPLDPEMSKSGHLYVNVFVIGSAFSISVKFSRVVSYAPDYFQKPDETYETFATVYSKHYLMSGNVKPSEVYGAIADLLDGFINEYIKANE